MIDTQVERTIIGTILFVLAIAGFLGHYLIWKSLPEKGDALVQRFARSEGQARRARCRRASRELARHRRRGAVSVRARGVRRGGQLWLALARAYEVAGNRPEAVLKLGYTRMS